jgi:AcrR family transcriptional regulator
MDANVTSVVEDPELVGKRRKQIVAAATKLFGEHGFYKTTIKDIAKKAGISPGMIYLYIREKDDLLLLVLLDVIDAYARELPRAMEGATHPLERLIRAVKAYCRIVDRHRAATVLAYRSTKSLSLERRTLIQEQEIRTNAIIAKEIDECIKSGLIRRINVDVLTYQIVLLAHGWALKTWYFKSRMSLDEYMDDSIDILLTGVLTPIGRRKFAALSKQEGGI